MFAKSTSKDLSLSVAVIVAGGAALILAMRQHWSPGDLSPGVEGAITTSLIGFFMLLLHGIDYPRTVAVNVPVGAMLYAACALGASPAQGLGMVGIHAVVVGVVGLALSFREPRPEPSAEDKRPLSASHPAHSQA